MEQPSKEFIERLTSLEPELVEGAGAFDEHDFLEQEEAEDEAED